ncbi:MAG: DUF6125 family protein [Bacteroidota bacterium]
MDIDDLSRERLLQLLSDFAKRWLAHDGLWFQTVERHDGMEKAIQYDGEAWKTFTELEASRIRDFLRLPDGGGLHALEQALKFRLYAFINEQEVEWLDDRTMVFRMKRCRVQEARQRKGLPDFPCKSVGIIEYTGFARAIDPRIQTTCLACPPDPHPKEYFCAWMFTILGTSTQREAEQ